MSRKIAGKVLKYGDSVDTDIILAGQYLGLSTAETSELAKHAMEAIDPDFAQRVKKAPVLIAGKNFGCGSSREQAPVALKASGVDIIIAESFGRIFFRNAINIGLPLMVCPGISAKIEEDDMIEADLAAGTIKDITRNRAFQGEELPGFILAIIDSGGLIPQRERELEESRDSKEA